MRTEWNVEIGLLDSSGNELKAPGYKPITVKLVEWQGAAQSEGPIVFREAVGPAWGTVGGWRIAKWRVPFTRSFIVTENVSVELHQIQVPVRSLEDM